MAFETVVRARQFLRGINIHSGGCADRESSTKHSAQHEQFDRFHFHFSLYKLFKQKNIALWVGIVYNREGNQYGLSALNESDLCSNLSDQGLIPE
jgi:hypothetical protein